MSLPLISVIVPCYNQGQYLDECLQSVLDQTYKNWECIIVNDGSPDNTEDVAKKWTEKDARFKYLYKENGGLSSARNAGINMALGKWILPLDSDDRIETSYLEQAVPLFKKNCTIITGKVEFFGERSGKWQLPLFSYKNLLLENIIVCTSFFQKDDWFNVGGYDENMKMGFEDWEFWIRILNGKQEKLYTIDKVCFYYRIKKKSMIIETTKNADSIKEYIYEKHKEIYEETFGNYLNILGKLAAKDKLILKYENILTSKRYRLMAKFIKFLKI